MHRLAIGENDDAQPASAGFFYSGPAADSTIRLPPFVLRKGDYPSNPGFADDGAVAATSNDVEVFRRLHVSEITTRGPLAG